MAFQRFSVAAGLGLFVCCSDDEEELSEDGMIGNFMTQGGESIVLSSEMLSQRLQRHPPHTHSSVGLMMRLQMHRGLT